jgi:peptidoglycan/xylan/chitin deacetylase (PgdA/CDA1 family)
MRDRISEYKGLLSAAKAQGYTFITVSDLAAIANGAMAPPDLAFVLRNDVDTDIYTARLMFDAEKALNIRATYYFRLSTIDANLMHDMRIHGTEIGYHFEEVATFAKRLGLRRSDEVESNLETIRSEFRQNIKFYKSVTGSFPKTVASHGDFCNRFLRVTNSCIVDSSVRGEFGILAEVYDEWLNTPVTLRLSDKDAPDWWSPMPLREALRKKPACLYVLVHPRQWRANIRENLKAEAVRLVEGVRFFAARTGNVRRSAERRT